MSQTATTIELPPPLSSQTGWPFDRSTTAVEISAEELAVLPTISIITPSYQQGEYIEQTIRSILLQGYPKLEYIIMDGGSSDQTVEVIRHYADFIDYWQSEKDKGQSDAIHRGWSRATGTLVAWLNSDDWYLEGTLLKVGRAFVAHGEPAWMIGCVHNFRSGKFETVITPGPMDLVEMMGGKNYCWHQPGMFWTRALIQEMGPLREDLHLGFDHEYFLRILQKGYQPVFLPDMLTAFRIHGDAKSNSRMDDVVVEYRAILDMYRSMLNEEQYEQVHKYLDLWHAEYLFKIARHIKRRGGRLEAVRYLFKHLRLVPLIQPKPWKQFLGALVRIGFGK